jgi:hypothetical protein
MGKTGQWGHEAFPFLRHVPWNAYKMCVLHALLAMGRVFCHWLFNWLNHLETETGMESVWDIAASWLKVIHVSVNIQEKPIRGSWSVKGIRCMLLYSCYIDFIKGDHVKNMWTYLHLLAQWISIPPQVLHAVALMQQAFHVLYIFEFKTAATLKKLAWYKANIKQVSCYFENVY